MADRRDIVTAIGDRPVRNWQDLQRFLQLEAAVGDMVALTALRDGRPLTLTLTLAAQP